MTAITNDTIVHLLATNDDPLTFAEFCEWNGFEPETVNAIAASLAENGRYTGTDEAGEWAVAVVENNS